jgi:putative peptidoglycan lipid II flippase
VPETDAIDGLPVAAPLDDPDRPGDGGAIDSTRTSAMASAGIFLSRIAGLLREITMANFLGNFGAADAFRAATRIPNLLQNLLGEGTLSAAFIPVYAKLLGDGEDAEARKVANAVLGLLVALTGVLVAAGIFFAPQLTSVLAPGFEGSRYDLTVDLVQITTLGIGFLVLSAWCLGVLNAHRRFFLSYVAPVVWNATQIVAVVAAGTLAFTDDGVARAMAWGMTLGGLLQFVVQLPTVVRVGGSIRPSLDVRNPAVKRVLTRFGPAVLGRGVVAISSYVELIFASFLAIGAVSALSIAQVLYILPISLFALAISAAELPELARAGGSAVADRLVPALRRMLFFVWFSLVLFLFGGRLVVGMLFERGRFGPDDTTLVWAILAAYCLGLLAICTSRLLQNTLFALGDTKGPAVIVLVRSVVGALVTVVLMFQLDNVVVTVSGFEGWDDLPSAIAPLSESLREDESAPLRMGAVGIALGAVVGNWVEYVLLRRRLHATVGQVPQVAPLLRPLLPAGAAAAAIALAGSLAATTVGVWIVGPPALALSGAAYLGLSYRAGDPQARGLVTLALDRVPARLRR